MNQSLNDAIALLQRKGWREHRTAGENARCFYQRFDTPTRCACNHTKPGIQARVRVTEHHPWWGYEIDVAGELSDGTWIIIHGYAMPPSIEDGLKTVPRLLATWEAAANFKP